MEREFDPKLTWNSSRDDIINEFYKPALSNCVLYQRLSGYFSSSTFANVANEILDFIRSKSKIQLITSPNLSDTDKQLFEQSVLEGEKLLSTIFLEMPSDNPINSITILTFGFFVISKGFLKKIFLLTLKLLFLLIFLAEIAAIVMFVLVLRPISFFLDIISLYKRLPIFPSPTIPIPIFFIIFLI